MTKKRVYGFLEEILQGVQHSQINFYDDDGETYGIVAKQKFEKTDIDALIGSRILFTKEEHKYKTNSHRAIISVLDGKYIGKKYVFDLECNCDEYDEEN